MRSKSLFYACMIVGSIVALLAVIPVIMTLNDGIFLALFIASVVVALCVAAPILSSAWEELITFTCPSCSDRYGVAKTLLGKEIMCRTCQRRSTVIEYVPVPAVKQIGVETMKTTPIQIPVKAILVWIISVVFLFMAGRARDNMDFIAAYFFSGTSFFFIGIGFVVCAIERLKVQRPPTS